MPTSKTDTRAMSYAVSKLFKNAYATYRENMYKVELIETGKNIPLDWSTYNGMKQRLRLLDLKTFDGLALPVFEKPQTESDIGRYYLDFFKRIKINEPSQVIAKLTPELETFMCDNCFRLFRGIYAIEGINNFTFKCPTCHEMLSQAPVLVRSKKSKEERTDRPMVTHIRANKKVCPHCHKEDWLGLTSRNPEQPMGSLTWVCVHCKKDVAPLETFKFGNRPQEPTENLTKGITVGITKAEELMPFKIEAFLKKDMCNGAFYSDKVIVSQVTWGYKLGQYENVDYKTFPNNQYYGRQFETQGIVIDLNPKIYEEAKEYLKKLYAEDSEMYEDFIKDIEHEDPEMKEMQLKRWVLHTLKHALLVYMPVITGLPHREFSGSYDLDKNRVIIFDNQEGGIGGCQKLWKNPDNLINLLDLITDAIEKCDCRSKCPKCILLDTCGEVNQALNRHLLVPLFENLETFYE